MRWKPLMRSALKSLFLMRLEMNRRVVILFGMSQTRT